MNRRQSRRWIIPEVVQTSTMDCGPAALKALLEGFGMPASYSRLREVCHTNVDGTSINALEEAALLVGLDAEQVIVPADHLCMPESAVLPAIVAMWTPGKLIHFVVAWRRHGPVVQVMDPSTGRRWLSEPEMRRQLYAHELEIEATQWSDWATSPDFMRPLESRLVAIGLSKRDVGTLLQQALSKQAEAQSAWRPLARLDAAARMVTELTRSGGLGRRDARRLVRVLADPEEPDDIVPDQFWSARPVVAPGSVEMVHLRGAVIVTVRARNTAHARPEPEKTSPSESPAFITGVAEPPTRLWRDVFRVLRRDGGFPLALLAASATAAASVMIEALLFRAFLDVGGVISPEYRWLAVGVMAAFLGTCLAMHWPIAAGLQRAGRLLEMHLRTGFLLKVPRLGDRYFRTRLVADLAERSHVVHTVRRLPPLLGRFFALVFELLFTVAGIAWLDPRSGLVAAGVAVVVLSLPLLFQSLLVERDLRVRTHSGALMRFAFDVSLGLKAVRAHTAERPVRRQHEALLTEWVRAGLRLNRSGALLATLQNVAAFGGVAWLLWMYVERAGVVATPLLLAYWCLRIPLLSDELTAMARQYPRYRNAMLRLQEPLREPDDVNTHGVCRVGDARRGRHGVDIRFEHVGVQSSGRALLDAVNLRIDAGSHIAVVGPSGAGKSTLFGVLLGWHAAAPGRVLIDGQLLTSDRLAWLRSVTAWVDPSVHLWNRSFLENIVYGSANSSDVSLGQIIEQTELRAVLSRLRDGWETSLGEGGGAISGGEGQRVRLGRAWAGSDQQLVLLDEPFRALDRPTRQRLLARTREQYAHATLLCVTHDLAETLSFDQVIVINEGRIVETGDPRQLADREGSRYRALLRGEEEARERCWGNPSWRHLRLADGQVRSA